MLRGISCGSPSFCMAVGYDVSASGARHSLAERWNGSAWAVLPTPPGSGLGAVSCSSKHFCMTLGSGNHVETWNGHAWHQSQGPRPGLSQVSCISSALCMGVGVEQPDSELPWLWNGRTWRVQLTSFCSEYAPGPCTLPAISCAPGPKCMAVGTVTVTGEGEQNTVAIIWNGKKWSYPGPGAPGGPSSAYGSQLSSVSCTKKFVCGVLGGYPPETPENSEVAIAAVWAGGSWQNWPNSATCGNYCGSQVTCGSATFCLTFGLSSTGGVLEWTGTAWEQVSGPGSGYGDASCAGPAFCMAVGSHVNGSGSARALASEWTGSGWKAVRIPSPG